MSFDKTTLRYQVASLGVATFIAGTLLALANSITAPHIAERKAEDLRKSLTAVIPTAIHDNDLLQDQRLWTENGQAQPLYLAKQGDHITAVAFEVSKEGYAGPIQLLMAVDANGEILGVRTLSHMETPGLGDKIEIKKDDWILSFNGKSLENAQFAVKKDGGEFDQFTGATITPRAVVEAVAGGLQRFAAQKSTILEVTDHDNP